MFCNITRASSFVHACSLGQYYISSYRMNKGTKMSTAQQHCEHHARQLMVVEFFLWLKTTALQQLTKPGPLLRRQEYLCQGLQTKDVLLNGNTESLGHAAKHWVALKAILCDQTLTKCCKTNRTTFYSAKGWWYKADCKRSDPRVCQSKEMGIFFNSPSQLPELDSAEQLGCNS